MLKDHFRGVDMRLDFKRRAGGLCILGLSLGLDLEGIWMEIEGNAGILIGLQESREWTSRNPNI